MGSRAYLARSGWRETAISPEEWRTAASSIPELEVHASYRDDAVFAVLRGSQRRRLNWHDGYISAHHPDPRLIGILFALAERLGAQVYSEHRRPYLDVADWRQRQQRRQRTYQPHERGYGTHHAARPAMGRADWLPFAAFMVALAFLALWALDLSST